MYDEVISQLREDTIHDVAVPSCVRLTTKYGMRNGIWNGIWNGMEYGMKLPVLAGPDMRSLLPLVTVPSTLMHEQS